MSTFVYSKKDFIKWVEKQFPIDAVVVFTNSVCGSLSVSKKAGIKITHQYADTIFKAEGIGHIAFGKTRSFGMLVTQKEQISEIGMDILQPKTESK